MRVAAACTALMLLAAPALAARLTPQQQLDRQLAGRTAGKPVACIPLTRVDNESTTFDGIGVTYRQGRTLYLNRFGGACRQLTNYRILVTRSFGGQLCRGDFADIVEPTGRIPVGTCNFDDFTPYTLPKK